VLLLVAKDLEGGCACLTSINVVLILHGAHTEAVSFLFS
jgi:hypothetical protein